MFSKSLIVSATFDEVAGLLLIPKKQQEFGKLYDIPNLAPDVQLLVTGVGAIATAFYLGSILANNTFNLLINVGLAGTFHLDWELGKVVQVGEDQFAYFGTENKEEYLSIFDMGLINPNLSPFKEGKLFPIQHQNLYFEEEIEIAKALTVNLVHGREDSIKLAVKYFNADIETMEGASFLFAANLSGIPSLQIRAISNFIEPRNRENWKIDLALNALWNTIFKLFKNNKLV